jgi:hypothetical protein
MLEQSRDDRKRADSKATVVFAVIGVVLAALLAAAFAGDWTRVELSLGAEVLAWVALSGIYASLVSAGVAIFPHLKIANPRRSSATSPR